MDLLRLSAFDTSSEEGRSKERHRRAILTAAAAGAAKVVSVGTALISVPLTLHYLGSERYGMWLTISSVVAMMSFADFGIGNGLLNAVAQANGKDDRRAMQGLVSSAFLVLSGIALLIGSIAAIAYPFVSWPRLFNVESVLAASEAGPALAVFLACFLFAIPLGVVQKVQIGLQQGFAVSLWQCGASLLSLGCLLLVIHCEGGLPWLVLAFVGSPLMANALNALIFFGIQARDISPSIIRASGGDMERIARIGALFLVLQIVIAVAFSSDNIVIAQILGAQSVPDYAVPAQMFNLIASVVFMVLSGLWPAYGEAIARGDHKWAIRTYVRSLSVSVPLAACASAILILAAPQILKVWVGRVIDPPLLLLIGFGVWKTLEAGGNATAMFLNGASIVKFQIVASVSMGISAILLKVLLVKWIGVAGAVWATVAANVLCVTIPYIIVVPNILSRMYNSSGPGYPTNVNST